jgi:transposase-like protein
MTADLTAPIFTDEDAARAHFESLRWPDGRVCPHCGSVDNSALLQGRSTRPGLYKCRDCRKPFSAIMGTVYEKSHIPLHKWLLATHLLVSSKKGLSAHQLYRMLGFGSYRTAWFMAHRIREAMNGGDVTPPMGSDGGAVEVDETFIGNLKERPKARGGAGHKMKVVSLVERNTGRARSVVVEDLSMKTIGPILERNVSRNAHLMTDEAPRYTAVGWNFAAHGVVNHGKEEYVRYEAVNVHTNTIEGFFSVFKRGMRGVYQHCGEQHLHRYMCEFDFRYTNRSAVGVKDAERAAKAVAATVGKRLTYRRPHGLKAA